MRLVHPADTFACKVNAFISMVLAYSLAHVYLSTSGIALLIMLGFNDKKPFFKRAAFAFSGFGYIYGIVISIIYGVAGMFGNYRNMYCMIPVDKYNNWGLILVRKRPFDPRYRTASFKYLFLLCRTLSSGVWGVCLRSLLFSVHAHGRALSSWASKCWFVS